MGDEGFWAKVHAFVTGIDQRSYYEVLRVPPTADVDAVKASFYRWAPQLHPDRYARETDPRRRWELSLLYARMREAYDVLSDPIKRRTYDEGLRAGFKRYSPDATRRQAAPQLGSERARRFYEMGLERKRAGKLTEAEFQFQMALQVEPDSALLRKALDEVRATSPEVSSASPEPARPAAATAPDPGDGMPKITFGARTGKPAAASSSGMKRPRPARPQPPSTHSSPPPTQKPSGEPAPIVGIDFGTTRSSVAVAYGDRVYMVPDAMGRTLHPSVVHYQDNGLTVCGWSARNLVFQAPRRTVSSPKRMLGRGFSDARSPAFCTRRPTRP